MDYKLVEQPPVEDPQQSVQPTAEDLQQSEDKEKKNIPEPQAPKLSKNGKPIGRPRLTEEQKKLNKEKKKQVVVKTAIEQTLKEIQPQIIYDDSNLEVQRLQEKIIQLEQKVSKKNKKRKAEIKNLVEIKTSEQQQLEEKVEKSVQEIKKETKQQIDVTVAKQQEHQMNLLQIIMQNQQQAQQQNKYQSLLQSLAK